MKFYGGLISTELRRVRYDSWAFLGSLIGQYRPHTINGCESLYKYPIDVC